jgi:hypothetical protein
MVPIAETHGPSTATCSVVVGRSKSIGNPCCVACPATTTPLPDIEKARARSRARSDRVHRIANPVAATGPRCPPGRERRSPWSAAADTRRRCAGGPATARRLRVRSGASTWCHPREATVEPEPSTAHASDDDDRVARPSRRDRADALARLRRRDATAWPWVSIRSMLIADRDHRSRHRG